jgi:hypothetical protein
MNDQETLEVLFTGSILLVFGYCFWINLAP